MTAARGGYALNFSPTASSRICSGPRGARTERERSPLTARQSDRVGSVSRPSVFGRIRCGVAHRRTMPLLQPPRDEVEPDEMPTSARMRDQFARTVGVRGRIWTARKHEDPRATIFSVAGSTRALPKGMTHFKKEHATGHYQAPPPPPPLRRKEIVPKQYIPAEELDAIAETFEQHIEMEASKKPAAPGVRVQLGQIFLNKEDAMKRVIKEWDPKGRGEFSRAEFRLNLRQLGLHVSSAHADDIFDSWDENKGGMLDVNELRKGFSAVREEARIFVRQAAGDDPGAERIAELRKAAALAREAAEMTRQATALESLHQEFIASITDRGDLTLGEFLSKRRVKPGEMVVYWSAPRGPHAGELSKEDFRTFCQTLRLPESVTADDIDAVFNRYDEDGGGYLDRKEAKQMIRGLQDTADASEAKGRQKERAARDMRRTATRLAQQVRASALDEPVAVPDPQPLPPPTTKSASKANKAAKAKPKRGDPSRGQVPSYLRVDGEGGAEEEAQMHQRHDVMRFAHRMRYAATARAFSSWQQVRDERRAALAELTKAVARFKNVGLTGGLAAWTAWVAMRNTISLSRRLLMKRSHHKAWMAWHAACERRRRLLTLTRRLEGFAAPSGRLQTKMRLARLSDAMRVWRPEGAGRRSSSSLINALCVCISAPFGANDGAAAPPAVATVNTASVPALELSSLPNRDDAAAVLQRVITNNLSRQKARAPVEVAKATASKRVIYNEVTSGANQPPSPEMLFLFGAQDDDAWVTEGISRRDSRSVSPDPSARHASVPLPSGLYNA